MVGGVWGVGCAVGCGGMRACLSRIRVKSAVRKEGLQDLELPLAVGLSL